MPYIFVCIYPGNYLCDENVVLTTSEIVTRRIYASRMIYLVNKEKLPIEYSDISFIQLERNNPIFKDGFYPVQNMFDDLSSTSIDIIAQNTWYEPKTVFTLSISKKRYSCDIYHHICYRYDHE